MSDIPEENIYFESLAAVSDGYSEAFNPNHEYLELNYLELKFYITRTNYPDQYLSINGTTIMQTQVQTYINDMAKESWQPRFTTNVWKNGVWKIECLDVQSRNWLFWYLGNTYQYSGIDMSFFAPNSLPKIYYLGIFPDNNTLASQCDQILTQLNMHNNGLDISHWKIYTVIQEPDENGELQIVFEIDAISRGFIRDNNCLLNYGNYNIPFQAVEIREDNPEEECDRLLMYVDDDDEE